MVGAGDDPACGGWLTTPSSTESSPALGPGVWARTSREGTLAQAGGVSLGAAWSSVSAALPVTAKARWGEEREGFAA